MKSAFFHLVPLATLPPPAIRVVAESHPRIADGRASESVAISSDGHPLAADRLGHVDAPLNRFQKWEKIPSKEPKGACMAATLRYRSKFAHVGEIEFNRFHEAGIATMRIKARQKVREAYTAPRIACAPRHGETWRQNRARAGQKVNQGASRARAGRLSSLGFSGRPPTRFARPRGSIRSGRHESEKHHIDGLCCRDEA